MEKGKMKGCRKSRIHVPEMLVMEILTKLPAKSLTRFRCVNKSWCSSFQTQHFITKHHQNNLKNNNLNLLFKTCTNNTSRPYFSSLSTDKGQNFLVKHTIHITPSEVCFNDPLISGPCHGILCVHDNMTGKVGLWNPSTREFKTLPRSTIQRPPSTDSTSFGCVGFGFDSQTNDYKVVRVVTNYFDDFVENGEGVLMRGNHQVELYSLNSDSWKEILVPENYPYGSLYGSLWFHTCINGVYYWQATGFGYDHLILSFDMVNEQLSALPFPEFDGLLAQYRLQLLEFNGLLGVLVYPKQRIELFWHLWVMNGSCWTKQLYIESVSGLERPLGFWKNGELFLESSDNELVLFDSSTQVIKNLGIHAYPETMQIITYVESLVPINGRSEREEHIIRWPASDASN